VLPWWGWVLLWVGLFAGAAVWIGVLARRTWRSAAALGREVSRAGAMVEALEARVDELQDLDPPPTAVTQPPHRLREEYREERARQVAARRVRRAGRTPPWARVD
jgi:hypothetical protein